MNLSLLQFFDYVFNREYRSKSKYWGDDTARMLALAWTSVNITLNLLAIIIIWAILTRNEYLVGFPPEGKWVLLVVYAVIISIGYSRWGRRDSAKRILWAFDSETARERKIRTLALYSYIIGSIIAPLILALIAREMYRLPIITS